MKAITVKSIEVLDEALQTEVHHTFGMEHYTDYVFKPRGDRKYEATLVMEDSSELIHKVTEGSKAFPEHEFLIVVLDTDSNVVKKYYIKAGEYLKITNR
jgi:hypothetical protein